MEGAAVVVVVVVVLLVVVVVDEPSPETSTTDKLPVPLNGTINSWLDDVCSWAGELAGLLAKVACRLSTTLTVAAIRVDVVAGTSRGPAEVDSFATLAALVVVLADSPVWKLTTPRAIDSPSFACPSLGASKLATGDSGSEAC